MNQYEKHLAETLAIPKICKSNPQTLWNLDDKKFFAAGACHVLAFAHIEICKDARIYIIQPKNTRGTHVFTSNGEWCFDSFGCQKYDDFMSAYVATCKKLLGDNWDCEILEVSEAFDEFCVKYKHRAVDAFLENPFPRAQLFVESFGKTKTSIKYIETL